MLSITSNLSSVKVTLKTEKAFGFRSSRLIRLTDDAHTCPSILRGGGVLLLVLLEVRRSLEMLS